MKKMDYTVGGRGRQRTITPLTERARKRTPEPMDFSDREEALGYLKAAQAEGFRFAGAELIDPQQRLVRNRYFAIAASGQLVPCGQDWGPLDTVWEIGDAMPGQTRNTGTEAVIEQIVKGDIAKKLGCDIAFILRIRDISGVN